MSMAAGELNRRIAILKRGVAVDGTNQQIGVLEPYLTLWARILGATGMAAVRAAQEGIALAPGRYSFRIRYRPTGVDAGMAVKYQEMVFDIVDVRHDLANHDYTDLVCETGANNG